MSEVDIECIERMVNKLLDKAGKDPRLTPRLLREKTEQRLDLKKDHLKSSRTLIKELICSWWKKNNGNESNSSSISGGKNASRGLSNGDSSSSTSKNDNSNNNNNNNNNNNRTSSNSNDSLEREEWKAVIQCSVYLYGCIVCAEILSIIPSSHLHIWMLTDIIINMLLHQHTVSSSCCAELSLLLYIHTTASKASPSVGL